MYAIFQNRLFKCKSEFDFCNSVVDSSERYNKDRHTSKDAFIERVLDATDAAGNSIFFFKTQKSALWYILEQLTEYSDDEKEVIICVDLLRELFENKGKN